MSIAAMYRTWVPTVSRWGYLDQLGDFVEVYSEFKYYKGNIQPFKKGFGLEDNVTGELLFLEYLLLYTREEVAFEQPSSIPETEDADMVFRWFYFDGKWYTIQGDENWSVSGRAPKHFKYSGKYQSGQGYVGNDVGDPVPLPELVSEFEAVVRELNQLSNYYD